MQPRLKVNLLTEAMPESLKFLYRNGKGEVGPLVAIPFSTEREKWETAESLKTAKAF